MLFLSNFRRFIGLAACLLFPFLWACDDDITVSTASAYPILNVDAWLNNKSEKQYIYLTTTQDYFDNDDLPPTVSGATVTVTDDQGKVFAFIEDNTNLDGAYVWTPASGETIGVVGRSYTLAVVYDGETFTSTSSMNRVPPVDSITLTLEEGSGMMSDEYRAQFWATDPAGKGDVYRIKTYKNGSLLNKTSEMNIAYDGGTSSGSGFDGVTFSLPVRSAINAFDEDEDGKRVAPLVNGDSIYVEINSLNLVSYNYLNEVITQTDRNGGLSELFTSAPLANVSTNITNTNTNGSAVVGFFNVAAVKGYGKKLYFQIVN